MLELLAILERMSEHGRVRVVNRKDPRHRIQFPARENAERWLDNHDPKLWDIVPIDEVDDELSTGDGTDVT